MILLIAPSLLQQLQRSKLVSRSAEANVGFGNRSSRGRGPGIEFADYRDYVPGDDIRHVDRHVLARLGRAVVRQSTPEQALQVVVLIDASTSMGCGVPTKLARAAELAAALAAVAVANGDHVDLALFADGTLTWHDDRLSSDRRLPRAFTWLQEARPGGASDMREVARRSHDRLNPGSMLIVVSDWMVAGAQEALLLWRSIGLDVVAIQVLAPEELDPVPATTGPLRLTDSETGDVLDVMLDDAAIAAYRSHFSAWQHETRDIVVKNMGRWFTARCDDSLEDTVLRRWRHERLIT
jgi:uncharacterized protein (DUF58 family)